MNVDKNVKYGKTNLKPKLRVETSMHSVVVTPIIMLSTNPLHEYSTEPTGFHQPQAKTPSMNNAAANDNP